MYPESVELVFDVYRVCVFFWILTGLTWLGGIIQMVWYVKQFYRCIIADNLSDNYSFSSLVSNSRKNESQAVSMTESFLVTGGETEKGHGLMSSELKKPPI